MNVHSQKVNSARAEPRILITVIDDHRGTNGMMLFIVTEAMLFMLLLFSYYYLANGNWVWPQEKPPKLKFAIPLLLILLCSSSVLYWGESQGQRRQHDRGRAASVGVIVLGLAFLVLQGIEYYEHLKTLTPYTNAYGSIFYTITSVPTLHVRIGLCMLMYVLFLPLLESASVLLTGPCITPPLLAFCHCHLGDRR